MKLCHSVNHGYSCWPGSPPPPAAALQPKPAGRSCAPAGGTGRDTHTPTRLSHIQATDRKQPAHAKTLHYSNCSLFCLIAGNYDFCWSQCSVCAKAAQLFLLITLSVKIYTRVCSCNLHTRVPTDAQRSDATRLYVMTSNRHNSLFIAAGNPRSAEAHYCSAHSCRTFAPHAQTDLTLPWPRVDNAIQKRRVCSCFKTGETDHPSFLLSIQRDFN